MKRLEREKLQEQKRRDGFEEKEEKESDGTPSSVETVSFVPPVIPRRSSTSGSPSTITRSTGSTLALPAVGVRAS